MDGLHRRLAERIQEVSSSRQPQRTIIGIAGPPGCGKSTIAAHVVQLLNDSQQDKASPKQNLAMAIGMDGFHYTRAQLDAFPDALEMHKRRGAPWTFDVEAILSFLHDLQASSDVPAAFRHIVYAPSFDHKTKDPIPGNLHVPADVEILILEGNYLLLDSEGWNQIDESLDLKVFVDVDTCLARDRVSARHVQAGIEPTLEHARKRFAYNDALNGEMIRSNKLAYDIMIHSINT